MTVKQLTILRAEEDFEAVTNIQNGNYIAAEENIVKAKAYTKQIELLGK